jgi:hypothetical protein
MKPEDPLAELSLLYLARQPDETEEILEEEDEWYLYGI